MSERRYPTYVCQHCGATWTNTGQGRRGGSHKTRYCSATCRDAARRGVNKTNRSKVPIGRRFVRSHDGEACVILADVEGLPYALELRRMEYVG